MAVPMGSAAKVVAFGGLTRHVALFRVAGVALRVIPTCFITRPESFCGTGAILLQGLQKTSYIFLAGAALWTCPWSFCVAGAAR